METNQTKQNVKSKSEKLGYEKRLSERKQINYQFFKSPKQVYRSMKGNNIIVEKLTEKETDEKLGRDICQNEASFNDKVE